MLSSKYKKIQSQKSIPDSQRITPYNAIIIILYSVLLFWIYTRDILCTMRTCILLSACSGWEWSVCGCVVSRSVAKGCFVGRGEGLEVRSGRRGEVAQSPLAAVQDMRDIACVTGCLVCPVSESQESRNYNNLATGAVLYNEATAAAVWRACVAQWAYIGL